MKNITHLLDVIDKVRDDVALGLMSDPGLSKTAQVKQWAEKNGRRYCELIISQRMPSEISGMPMPIAETRTMEVFDYNTLLELKDGDVLAFDEFTNGNIQTLNACLTLIQERTMLSGKKLPSLLIVAMGNPQGKCDLLPQTKQRFWWVNVTWDPDTWAKYMENKWGFRPKPYILSVISNQYSTGFSKQSTYNYYTPRTVENLFRIAKQIPPGDPFWTVSDVSAAMQEALYQSIEQQSIHLMIVQEMTQWLLDNKPNDETAAEIVVSLHTQETTAQLRDYINWIEQTGVMPDLIDYLKSSELNLARDGESDG